MNIITLTGRLTKDPELTYTQSGMAKVRFTVASQRRMKNTKTNQYDSDFINCQAWGKTAEFIANNTIKGNRVEVTGSLQNNNYEREGKMVYQDIVNVDSFQPIDWANSNQQQQPQQPQPQQQQQQQQQNNYTGAVYDPFANSKGPVEVSEDDLPF